MRPKFLSSYSIYIKFVCQTTKVSRYLLFISVLISSQTVTNSLLISRQAKMLLLGNDYIFYFSLELYMDLNILHNKYMMNYHTGN